MADKTPAHLSCDPTTDQLVVSVPAAQGRATPNLYASTSGNCRPTTSASCANTATPISRACAGRDTRAQAMSHTARKAANTVPTTYGRTTGPSNFLASAPP